MGQGYIITAYYQDNELHLLFIESPMVMYSIRQRILQCMLVSLLTAAA